MASNIEIKARLGRRVCPVHALANAVSDAQPVLIEHEDTFFNVTRGRLKLREFKGRADAELIYYERPDAREPTASTYSLISVADPGALKAALEAAVGIRGVVRKRRTLYLAGETRIHIDDVEGLGAFLELEVVLPDGSQRDRESDIRGNAQDTGSDAARAATPEEGLARCRELMDALGIDEGDLVDRAYIDLLEEAGG